MAMIKHHWRMVLLHLFVLSVAVAGAYYFFVRPARAITPSTAPAITQHGLDASTKRRIASQREILCLLNRDIAAMGCTGEQAEELLETLKSWNKEHASALALAEQARTTVDSDLRALSRKISMGPFVSANASALTELRQRAKVVAQTHRDLQESADAAVASRLSSNQSVVWQTAKHNRALPSQYRYVPNLNASEISLLQKAILIGARNADAQKSIEAQVITAPRKAALEAVEQEVQLRMTAVVAAEAQALPAEAPATTQPTTPS